MSNDGLASFQTPSALSMGMRRADAAVLRPLERLQVLLQPQNHLEASLERMMQLQRQKHKGNVDLRRIGALLRVRIASSMCMDGSRSRRAFFCFAFLTHPRYHPPRPPPGQNMGHTPTIRHSLGGQGGSCLRHLRYSFLFLRTSVDGALTDLILDLNFRDNFVISHPTRDFERVFEAVPEVFVGTPERLQSLVEFLCHEVAASFAAHGLSMPPWRKAPSLLTKWLPKEHDDVQPPVDVSPSPSSSTGLASPHGPPHGAAGSLAAHLGLAGPGVGSLPLLAGLQMGSWRGGAPIPAPARPQTINEDEPAALAALGGSFTEEYVGSASLDSGLRLLEDDDGPPPTGTPRRPDRRPPAALDLEACEPRPSLHAGGGGSGCLRPVPARLLGAYPAPPHAFAFANANVVGAGWGAPGQPCLSPSKVAARS